MLKSQAAVTAEPHFKLRAKLAPVGFEIGSGGSFTIATGHIRARCEEFPITLRIPFLRRRRGRVVAAVLGPSGLHIEPFEAHFRAMDVSITGVIGNNGLEGDLEGGGTCKMEIEVDGELPARLVKAVIAGLRED
jgi:hypothetical protein